MIAKASLFVCGLLILAVSSAVVLRAAPEATALRDAERLWIAGRAAEARQHYLQLAVQEPVPPLVLVRLATLALLRGTCSEAQAYAARALSQVAVRRDEAAQAHLVAGQCAAMSNIIERATGEWASLDPRSPYRRLSDVLRAEQALRAGNAAQALPLYQAALAEDRAAPVLAEPWTMLVRFRLALLLAADDPAQAQQLLATIPLSLPEATLETRPFLPLSSATLVQQSLQLRAILVQPAAQRDQLLGQQLLTLGLYRLAIAPFERSAAGSAETVVLANAQAAYARWQLGQRPAATAQLQELAAAAPDSAPVATLYATAALQSGQIAAASAALDAAEAHHPLDPALALVRADVLIAQHQYAQAIAELRRARDIAQPQVRGRYALALAAQHLSLTYNLCDSGITAARDATTIAPADPGAWQSLAAALYHCRSYAEAAGAARTGLALAPHEAGLNFFLGAALWADDQQDSARPYLLATIDRAPASEWRVRAEQLLGW